MKRFLAGEREFEESTLAPRLKSRYREEVKKLKGKCMECQGKLDRFGLFCKKCYGATELPWIEREMWKSVKETRARELDALFKGEPV